MAEHDTITYVEPSMNLSALLLLALTVTGLGTLLAYLVSGGVPLIGIDDAAITRNYAENIANGHGIVYYVGGERVEGSTSFLWTLIVAVTYLITPTPEVLILALGFACATASVFAVLALGTLLARRLDLPQRAVAITTAIGLLGLPGFFFWSVFTMMELGLWSAVLLTLTWRLARLAERPKPWSFSIVGLGILLPLIRPEGIAVTLGLMVLAALLMWRFPRGLKLAVAAAVASFAAVTAFRLIYFGYPVPNTFYAKVSSDRMQDLIDGAKYLFSFIGEFPFAETLMLFWGLVTLWALGRLFSRQTEGARGILLAAAAAAGIFAIYTALGGDHFAYWRFFQPVTPILLIAPVLLIVYLWKVQQNIVLTGTVTWMSASAFVCMLWLGASYGEYRQDRLGLVKEVKLVERGLKFGEFANSLKPKPVLGIGPAGGVALSYNGPILDLLGLNWVEMAHANPIKTGLRNHASFDQATFWKHKPDIIAEFNRICTPFNFIVHRTKQGMTKGLYLEPKFQKKYSPIRMHVEDRCWRGFARREWLTLQNSVQIEELDWSEVILLSNP